MIENEQNIPQEVPILIDRLPFKQLFEALECFTTRKLITVLPGQQVQVDKLHYPPQRSLIRDAVDVTTDLEEFIISPSALSYLRTKVLKRLKLEQQTRTFPTFGDKLFLQRKSKLGYRSATNIEEIEQLAESKGFSLVNPAEYSFLEQVAICSKAKVIMGTTGAHMTNCIFASAATVYILAGNTNPFLWSQLGDHLELTVKWVKGESIRKSAVPMPHDDYELPLAVVKELLETHL